MTQEEQPGARATVAELKAQGNEAYQQGDVAGAVDLWDRALGAHLEESAWGGGDSSAPALRQQGQDLEKSLYLNLAQGLLRLEEPEKALRACEIVLQGDPMNTKARLRAAEACIELKRWDEAGERTAAVLGQEEVGSVVRQRASQLMHQVHAGRRNDLRQQKKVAKRMCSGADGFASGREAAPKLPSPLRMQPSAIMAGVEVAEDAAKAALEREARLAAKTLPEPTVLPDLEAFRAKVAARSSKYTAFVDKKKQERQNAQRALKLQWLRAGNEKEEFEAFTSPLQEELRAIEAEDRETSATAAATAAAQLEAEVEGATKGVVDGGRRRTEGLTASTPDEGVAEPISQGLLDKGVKVSEQVLGLGSAEGKCVGGLGLDEMD